MFKKFELGKQIPIATAMNAVLDVADKLKVMNPPMPLIQQSFALQEISMHFGWYIDEIIAYTTTMSPPSATTATQTKQTF